MSNTKFTDGYRGGQRASCDCVRGSKREPIVFRDDVTIKIDSSGVGFTLGARDFKGVQCVVTYQKVTGCLSPGAHPGGANGQDAYTDLIVSSGGY